jgi:protein required for attachment to host cells
MASVHVPANALVLVGDGRKALFLRNFGTPRDIELRTEHEMKQNNPPTREQGSDRPGRYPGIDHASRNAFEETDWHHQAEQRFAAEIAKTLFHMAHTHQFEDLVLIAPPKLLGELRAALHTEVTERIVAEMPKDLTSHPVPEIAKLLS